MGVLGNLWQRHKNPISWIVRVIFFVLLCIGIWYHSWLLIAICIVGLATEWFWFPKPKKKILWAEVFIDEEKRWMKKRANKSKILAIVLGIVVFVFLVWGLWTHNWLMTVLALVGVVAVKLVALMDPIRKTIEAVRKKRNE